MEAGRQEQAQEEEQEQEQEGRARSRLARASKWCVVCLGQATCDCSISTMVPWMERSIDDPVRSHSGKSNVYTAPMFLTNPLPPKQLNQPVTWTSLGLMAVTGAGLGYYYQAEKEKKQQEGASRPLRWIDRLTGCLRPSLGGASGLD